MKKRLPSIVLGILIAPLAWAETGCDEVPEERRSQCEKVMDCLAIDDGDVRRACIDAAQQERQEKEVEPAPARRIERPPPAEPARARQTVPAVPAAELAEPRPPAKRAGVMQRLRQLVRRTPDPEPAPANEAQTPAAPPPEPQPQASRAPVMEERTFAVQRRGPTSSQQEQQQDAPSEPAADNFTAEVTRIHQSILERQVIALDKRYLFVSDRASQAGLKSGDMVQVERRKSRFRKGRGWRITGPSRYPIDAVRIRCESDDLRVDDRRRCAEMLDL